MKQVYIYNIIAHTSLISPVGTDARVVGNLVVVHSPLTLLHESVLLTVGPNTGCSLEGLLEVRVDGRTSHGLQTLQLTGCSHIETLGQVFVVVCEVG